MKRIIAFLLILCTCALLLISCSSAENEVVGKWYNEKNKCLDIRSDGSWKLDGSYGTGTWKMLDDNETVEFTDFYGDTQESVIHEKGEDRYIDFGYYGDFYKDVYPSDKEDNDTGKNKNSEDIYTDGKSDGAIAIDPFEGIEYVISGISPWCTVAVNTKNCSDDAQMYVTFYTDKDEYANGETVVVSAEIKSYTGNKKLVLNKTKSEFKVDNQPEYVSSVEDIDIGEIREEVEDWIESSIASAVKGGLSGYFNNFLMGYNVSGQIQSTSDLKAGDVYFSTLKKNKLESTKIYNMLSFTYSISYSGRYKSGKVYSTIVATNIVKYPDGTVKWGTSNPEAFDLRAEGTEQGMESCILTTVMNNKDNYNISKIEK